MTTGSITLVGKPSAWRNPGTLIADVGDVGGASVGVENTMIVGQMQASGSATPNTVQQIFTVADAVALFGPQAQITQVVAGYMNNDATASMFAVGVPDASGASAGYQTVTYTGTATAGGSAVVYVNNKPFAASVSVGDTANTVASNVANAINNGLVALSAQNVPVGIANVTVSNSTITVTSAHAGLSAGSDLVVTPNKGGRANGEATPAGLSVSVSALTSGSVDPDFTAALAAISNLKWLFLAFPFTTSTTNAAVVSLLNNTSGRWSPTIQLKGTAFNVLRAANHAATLAYGATIGSNKHLATLPAYDSQTSVAYTTGAWTGVVASVVKSNPALPIVGVLNGVDAPSLANRLNNSQKNQLLYAGLSLAVVNASGYYEVKRAIQNWQVDLNWLSVNTDMQLAYTDEYLRTGLNAAFNGFILLPDGSVVNGGTQAVTPQGVQDYAITLLAALQDMYIITRVKDTSVAAYHTADFVNGDVGLFLPIHLAGQLYTISVVNSFSIG